MVLGIGIYAFQTREIELKGLCLIQSVDSCNIPFAIGVASHHCTLARITCEKLGIVPCSRQLLKQCLDFGRHRKISRRTVRHVLNARLEENGESKLMTMGSDMRMLTVGESSWSIIHRTNDIASERQGSVVGCSKRREIWHVIIPFCPIDTFHRYEVWISALPATRQSSAMEIDKELALHGIFKDVDVVVHLL